MQIRLGTLDDLATLAEINAQGSEDGIKIARERLPAFIDGRNLLVAESDGSIIGLIYWKKEFYGTKSWELTQVTVDEEFRNKGVAQNLIKHFLEIAKSNDAPYVYAEVVRSNDPSTHLMSKLGAVKVGELDLGAELCVFWRISL